MFISTYLLQTHSLEASKTGEIAQPCSEGRQAPAGFRQQVWPQSPPSIRQSTGTGLSAPPYAEEGSSRMGRGGGSSRRKEYLETSSERLRKSVKRGRRGG